MINLNGPNLIFVNHKKNKVKFCDLNQQNILADREIDVIVDLNVYFSFGPSKFISYLKSYIKIGFKSHFSDYFYNLQLEADNKSTVENSYQKIQQILNSL